MIKKELREHTKRILLLGIILGMALGVIIGAIITLKGKTCENLAEDYKWLENNAKTCWNKLRILDDECWSTSDCIDNPGLEGCHKEDCNSCCFNSCTLILCGEIEDYSFSQKSETERSK